MSGGHNDTILQQNIDRHQPGIFGTITTAEVKFFNNELGSTQHICERDNENCRITKWDNKEFHPTAMVGSWGVVPVNDRPGVIYHSDGYNVTIYLPTYTAANGGSATAAPIVIGTLPPAIRPKDTINYAGAVPIRNNTTYAMGRVSVSGSGAITIYATLDAGNFSDTNAHVTGVLGGSISYHLFD